MAATASHVTTWSSARDEDDEVIGNWRTRMDVRKEKTLSVATRGNGALSIRGVTRNVSLKGMFVETDVPACEGSIVEVAIDLGHHHLDTPLSVRARVAHSSHDGMGITFLRFNRPLFRALQAIVFE